MTKPIKQNIIRRKIVVFTPEKHYIGDIHFEPASEKMRTLDILNRPNIVKANSNPLSSDDYIYLSAVSVGVTINTSQSFKTFNALFLNVSDILFAYDNVLDAGDDIEKIRATKLTEGVKDNEQHVEIITTATNGTFYNITGNVAGMRGAQTKYFFAMTAVQITRLTPHQEGYKKITFKEKPFIAFNHRYIESVNFTEEDKNQGIS